MEPCQACRSATGGSTYLAFVKRGDGEIFIENIKSPEPGSGWGTALVRALQGLYPDRTDWSAKRITDSGSVFWEKIDDRYGITLRILRPEDVPGYEPGPNPG